MKITLTVDAGDDAAEVHAMVDRILGAEAATAKTETAAAKKKRLAAEKAEAETAGPTREEVRTKLKEYAALEGKDAAIAILRENGSASIGELDEDKFVAVIAACE